MPDSNNADWILEIMMSLNSPDAELVRDVLDHMARLQSQHPPEPSRDIQPPAHSTAEVERAQEVQARRTALHNRLRDNWASVKHLPRCLMQAQILRETAALAAHTQILVDPLAESVGTPLTQELAGTYARQAVECAEEIGDQPELIEAYLVLGRHCLLTADFAEAQRCCLRAATLARQIRSLRHEANACQLIRSIASLAEMQPDTLIEIIEREVHALNQLGDTYRLAEALIGLAKLHILNKAPAEAEPSLARAAQIIDTIPETDTPSSGRPRKHMQGTYRRCCVLLRQAQGCPTDAAKELQISIVDKFDHPKYQSFGLAADIALLESLRQQAGDRAAFIAFCSDLQSRFSTALQQWDLILETPPSCTWDWTDPLSVPLLSPRWRWIDPLQKGAHSLADGLEITPAMGTGFLSNVYIPRLMLDTSGDFVFEVGMEWRGDRRRAGGILVYQDDNTLIRYGVGIDYDDDVTLSVKSPDLGLRIVGRGLLAQGDATTLRIARQGPHFAAWCSDGDQWYRCGQTHLELAGPIQVGLFAECAYRDWYSPIRCTTTPVRFVDARLQETQGI